MTERQTRFASYFDAAFSEMPGYSGSYTPTDKDIAYFNTILDEGVLKGADLPKVLPTAMRITVVSGAKISWYSVLYSLADHKRPYRKKSKAAKPESLPPTVLESLREAGFDETEIDKALQPHSMAAAQTVLKKVLGDQETGWELVESLTAHQVSKGLSTMAALEKHILDDELDLSWEHYKAWKQAHIATAAPREVKRIRKNWKFREWSNGGFPE